MGSQIGGGIQQIPRTAVIRNGYLRLGARLTAKHPLTQTSAIGTATVPLWESTPGSRTEDLDPHVRKLQFGVYVGIDFATKIDFFETRDGPLHVLNSIRW